MKSWKGWASTSGTVYPTEDDLINARPVLVIDASDFPEGYPEIDSEWLYQGVTVTILSQPWQNLSGVDEHWYATACEEGGVSLVVDLTQLKPIPKTAKGEVVGTITVSPEKWEISGAPVIDEWPEGEYDIIKRGDK